MVSFNPPCDVLATKADFIDTLPTGIVFFYRRAHFARYSLRLRRQGGFDVVAPGVDGEKGKVPMRAPLIPVTMPCITLPGCSLLLNASLIFELQILRSCIEALAIRFRSGMDQ
jgi:hypothetical protein